MSLPARLLGTLRRWYRPVPLPVRVALLLTPVIVVSQLATVGLLRNAIPVSVLRSGMDFGPLRQPPRFMADPGFDALLVDPRGSFSARQIPPLGAPPQRLLFQRNFVERGELDRPPIFFTRRWAPPWPLLLSQFCVTALIVWIAAWWLMRPLARLSRAAEQLGRNVTSAPLDQSGPPEVRLAAAAFNKMQDRLLRFIRGRSDALLAMSHDLKTPITRLQLRVALLPEWLQAPIIDDVRLLQTRVEDALMFMHGVHSAEPIQDVDVNALAALAVERLQDTGAKVSVAGSARTLRCRPGQLERALSNVLENAVRYGGGAELVITDSAEALTLRVLDRGPGIPEGLLERVTEPFFRVESSRNRDNGGTGLGLAITKDLVESMGGRLDLRNLDGGGFEAALSLPRQA